MSIGLSVHKKKLKIDFQDGCHGDRFLIGNILTIFELPVIPMLPTKFWVNRPFASGEEEKNRFSRWWPSCISDRNNFSCFWSTGQPDASFQVSWPFGSGEEAKNRFPRWWPWWPSWISHRKELAIFDLPVPPMLPTKFRVTWPRGVGGVGFQSNCWFRMTDDRHWLTTTAHLEHFMLNIQLTIGSRWSCMAHLSIREATPEVEPFFTQGL